MKKLLPFLMVAVMLLTGCGGASNNSASSTVSSSGIAQSAPSMNTESYSKSDADMGWIQTDTTDTVITEDAMVPSSGAATPPALANAKMIYTADLELETKEFDSVSQSLDQIVELFDGYYESRSLNQGGTYRRLNCTVRIPAEHFNDFLESAGEFAHVTNCNEYTEDVSEAYYDTEARLTTQRTKLERLHKLLEQAATMEDIIDLETAISDTELQIEYLTGSLRKYDSLVGYSTVHLTLREVYRLSTDEAVPLTFSQRLSSALITGLERGIDSLEDFVISIARNWLGILMLAAIGVVAVVAWRALRRKRRMRKAAKENTASCKNIQENQNDNP